MSDKLTVVRIPNSDFLRITEQEDHAPRISKLADIETSSRGSRLNIGARTVIDSFVKIKFAGGLADIEIGEDCVLNSGVVIYSGNGVKIGNGVAIAANCTIAPVNHNFKKSGPIRERGFRPSKGGIIIEDNVWIGANCVILDGAILREGCSIAAGIVVGQEVASNTLITGHRSVSPKQMD